MADERKPRVAIIGGFHELDAVSGRDAREYAQALGGSLAEAGFGLVVYWSEDSSLEPHVVRGFVAALPPDESEPCIDVRYSEAQRGQVRFQEQDTHPALFVEDAFPGQNWEAPFYRSLAARDGVDAALLMAGGQSTLNAGQVAVGRGVPLLAIDKVPGAARVLRTELAMRSAGYPSSQGASASQLIAWLRDQHQMEAERLRQARDLERQLGRMKHQRHGAAWFVVALVAFVATLGLGLSVDAPRWFMVAMGGALVTAGATGALVRGLTTTTTTLEPRLAVLLGSAAGVVVGLAYVIPQLIGAPQLLEPDASVVMATDRIQFMSVALVAFTAGIGFDAIFRRMLQEAETVPVSVKP